MAQYATTANYADMVLEVEWTANSGVYSRICGLTSRGIDRKSTTSSSEVPPCDDETLPAEVQKAVQSQEVTLTGSGVWSQESHENLLTWWRSGATLNVRIHHVKALTGQTEYETGPAILAELKNDGTRGTKVTADITLEFDGVPTPTAKP